MSELVRPLDESAKKKAYDEFYASHPEFIDESGNRIPIDPNKPEHAAAREEWKKLYIKNGGKTKDSPEQDAAPDNTEQSCPLKDKNKEKEEEKQPTIEVKWSKKEVTPDHNSQWPPSNAPLDKVPDEAEVTLFVDTTEVPDNKLASIEIRHCASGSLVKGGKKTGLRVKANKVIDPITGKRPVFSFFAEHKLWDPWNKPFYYFTATVEHKGLKKETSKDYENDADNCLKLLRWHYCVAESSTLSGVLPECNTVSGLLNGVADSKSAVQNLTTPNISLARFGSLLRNTYVFHVASHGTALNRKTGKGITKRDPGSSMSKSNWRSVVCITPSFAGDKEIKSKIDVPSVPKYLFYSSTCLTGWESSFADTMISRGCQNVIAFRRTVPDAEAPDLARKFYSNWANNYQLNPDKIADCFWKAAPDHHKNMKPILYGAGGGKTKGSNNTELILGVVAGVAAGVLIGVAVWALVKKKF